jgi:hypothetical protein
VRVWSYTWRPFWSEFGDALGANDRVSLAICTWRLCECDHHDCDQANIEMHIGGHRRAKFMEHWEVVNVEAVVRPGSVTGAKTLFIGQIVIVRM